MIHHLSAETALDYRLSEIGFLYHSEMAQQCRKFLNIPKGNILVIIRFKHQSAATIMDEHATVQQLRDLIKHSKQKSQGYHDKDS